MIYPSIYVKELEGSSYKELLKRVEEYINKNGNELEKEAIKIIKEFVEEREDESIKDTTKNVEELKTILAKLAEDNNNKKE